MSQVLCHWAIPATQQKASSQMSLRDNTLTGGARGQRLLKLLPPHPPPPKCPTKCSETNVYISLFSSIIPAAPQFTEFCLVTGEKKNLMPAFITLFVETVVYRHYGQQLVSKLLTFSESPAAPPGGLWRLCPGQQWQAHSECRHQGLGAEHVQCARISSCPAHISNNHEASSSSIYTHSPQTDHYS